MIFSTLAIPPALRLFHSLEQQLPGLVRGPPADLITTVFGVDVLGELLIAFERDRAVIDFPWPHRRCRQRRSRGTGCGHIPSARRRSRVLHRNSDFATFGDFVCKPFGRTRCAWLTFSQRRKQRPAPASRVRGSLQYPRWPLLPQIPQSPRRAIMSEIGTANLKRLKAQRELKPVLPASGDDQAAFPATDDAAEAT